MYQYSGWLILWSILYYFKIVMYPPLRIVILAALLFSMFLGIYYQIPICYNILSFLLHLSPLLFIDNKTDQTTMNYNIIVFLIYIITLELLKINIFDNYRKTVKQFQKNPTINDAIKKILFTKIFF